MGFAFIGALLGPSLLGFWDVGSPMVLVDIMTPEGEFDVEAGET